MLRPPEPSPAGAFSRPTGNPRGNVQSPRRSPLRCSVLLGRLRRLYRLTVGAVDFRRQAFPDCGSGLVARLAQVLGGFEGPFLRPAAVSRPAHPGMDADRLVEIDVHIVLVATAWWWGGL